MGSWVAILSDFVVRVLDKPSCNIMSPSIKSLVHQNNAYTHIMSLCTYDSVLALLRGRKDTAMH